VVVLQVAPDPFFWWICGGGEEPASSLAMSRAAGIVQFSESFHRAVGMTTASLGVGLLAGGIMAKHLVPVVWTLLVKTSSFWTCDGGVLAS
jgi:hypothetical protein